MGDLLSVAELERHMRTQFDEDDTLEASAVIEEAVAAIEDFLNRPVTVRTFTDVAVRVPAPFSAAYSLWRRGDLVLPHTPVVSVASITADGDAQDLTGLAVRPWGIASYAGAVGADGTILVTFDAGLDSPASAKRVAKRLAARDMAARSEGRQGVARIGDEGYSVDLVGTEGGLTAEEKRALRRLRRRAMSV